MGCAPSNAKKVKWDSITITKDKEKIEETVVKKRRKRRRKVKRNIANSHSVVADDKQIKEEEPVIIKTEIKAKTSSDDSESVIHLNLLKSTTSLRKTSVHAELAASVDSCSDRVWLTEAIIKQIPCIPPIKLRNGVSNWIQDVVPDTVIDPAPDHFSNSQTSFATDFSTCS